MIPRPPAGSLFGRELEAHGQALIRAAIERHGGNRSKAAQELGISLRGLYWWLARARRAGRVVPPGRYRGPGAVKRAVA
jgi:DNA-binding NtrC family response regulator